MVLPETSSRVLIHLLACLRAIHWSHWTQHWRVTGDVQYGAHLLFERIYGLMVEEIDELGEKIVSYHGPEAINAADLLGEGFRFLAPYQGGEDGPTALYERALRMELDLQKVIRDTYDTVKDHGDMSLGLDDFLMSMANRHESSVYLLRQQLR